MTGLQIPWKNPHMNTQTDDDLDAVKRTLRLAKAQLQILKKHFAKDTDKIHEIDDMEMALEIIIKKLSALAP